MTTPAAYRKFAFDCVREAETRIDFLFLDRQQLELVLAFCVVRSRRFILP
jgi:hypothetical protein